MVQDDAARDYRVPTTELNRKWLEGTVLSVAVDERGEPQWDSAVADLAETERRRADAQARIDRLRKRR